MSPGLQVVLYSALIVLASVAGGCVPLVTRLTHTGTQLLMSFVAGMMLGVGMFHMLPHAAHEIGSVERAVWWLMAGLLLMFFLQRLFHFHQHGPLESPEGHHPGACSHDHHHHDHGHAHGHSHGHAAHRHEPAARGTAHLNWLGVAVGLTLHTLMDGIALASSVEVEALGGRGVAGGLYGLGTALAVFLHKPLDAMAITGLMVAGAWSSRARHLTNVLFALVLPVGAGLFYLGAQQLHEQQRELVGCALAFSAGNFLCISLSDLLPEVQFHAHDRLKLSIALLLGVAASYSVGYLESSGHGHGYHRHVPAGNRLGQRPALRVPVRESPKTVVAITQVVQACGEMQCVAAIDP